MKTREEHLAYCRERAITEYDYYEPKSGDGSRQGLTSMMSDIMKHPETADRILQALLVEQMIIRPRMERQEFINFINGIK